MFPSRYFCLRAAGPGPARPAPLFQCLTIGGRTLGRNPVDAFGADAPGAADLHAFERAVLQESKDSGLAETEHFVAVATEEIAIRGAIPGDFAVSEAQAGEMRVWQR